MQIGYIISMSLRPTSQIEISSVTNPCDYPHFVQRQNFIYWIVQIIAHKAVTCVQIHGAILSELHISP